MNIKKLFQKEKPETKQHPKFTEYLEKGWLQKTIHEGEPIKVNGYDLYQLTNMEESVRTSRLLKFNYFMHQCETFGMTKENFEFNMKLQKGYGQRIRDARHDPDKLLQIAEALELSCLAFEEVKKVGINDEAVFGVAGIFYIFEFENPEEFDETAWEKKRNMFRNNDLSLFFWTAGLKVLSVSLQIFTEDFGSFMAEVMENSITALKMIQSTTATYLVLTSENLSEEERGYLEKQIKTQNERIRFLKNLQLTSTSGY